MDVIAKGKSRSVVVVCDLCSFFIPWDGDQASTIVCDRCGHHIGRYKPKSLTKTLAFTLTAIVFYIPALMFPFMMMEVNGNRTSSTIWQGVVSLNETGAWFIAIVVFLASIFIPLLKLLILLYLCFTAQNGQNLRLKSGLYRFIEHIGRWSMLDIFLLAVMVAIMKIAPWTYVEPSIGSLMFCLVVVFTMFASASFDPRLLWKESHGEN